MGIAWLLLTRTFRNRPKRTLLFLLGYALSTAVMVTLLAVGEAVLLQAQDKDLLGGGDLILVPQGIDIESMKVGGLTALYHSIPQGRFIVRQLLKSSRFKNEISGISPYVFSKLLYVGKENNTEAVFASGSIPDQEQRIKGIDLNWKNTLEDEAWLTPQADFYHQIDKFHLPSSPDIEAERWAEWHYFNFEADDFYGYLSIMAAGDILAGKGVWVVSLQFAKRTPGQMIYNRYAYQTAATKDELPLEKIDYVIDSNRVAFQDGAYVIDLNYATNDPEARQGIPVRGQLKFRPQPNLYFPPSYLAKSDSFESGYVIPAIRGKYEGALTIGTDAYDFSNVDGYHDHNWGIWRAVEWNWGHIFSENFSIFYGEILIDAKSKGLFAGVFDQTGFLSIFRPQSMEFSEYKYDPSYKINVPMRMRMRQTKNYSAMDITANAESYVATPVANSYFIQYKMKYDGEIQIDGRTQKFSGRGNAETYVPKTSEGAVLR